jgi:GNAT superfamily N-acetyltransferase
MQRPQVDEDVIVIRIRPSRSNDGPALRAIERSSGEQFRSIGMASVADDEPLSEDGLAVYAIDGRGWVAVDAADHPKGYVLVDEVDGNAHVAQISVLPELQGHGVGRALLDRVRIWATEVGCPAITLTTFNNVPWNRPLYEHLGFVVLSKEEIGPDLQVVVRDEANDGLDPDARVCMRVATNVSMIPDS